MVGTEYWYTGITVKHSGGKWCASLDFYDSDFCDDDSTEGRLTTRYFIDGLSRAIDILLADAARLGLVPSHTMPDCPTIYVPGDGEGAESAALPPDWRAQVRAECERRGWRCVYGPKTEAPTCEQ